MRRAPVIVSLGALLGACGARPTPVQQPPPPAPVAAPAPAPAAPRWPVPVRVLAWTEGGIEELGTLPDAPPAQPPAGAWFVEPMRQLDDAMFAQLVATLRREQVPGLSLRGQHVSLAPLTDLPALTALVLDDTATDGPALAALDVRLERLYLARTRVDDAAIAAVVARHPLRVIDLEDTAVGDAGARALATVLELRAANLARTQITDAGGAALGALPKLEVLDLGHTAAGVATAHAIRTLPLRQLFLDRTRIGRAVRELAPLAATLARIDLGTLVGYRPTDADLAWLAKAPHLIEVDLSGSRITDATALPIIALPSLRELRLATTGISLAAIDAIAARAELEEVDLAETVVDDARAARLCALPRLRVLRLDRTAVGDAGLATPGAALTELYLTRTKVTDAGLAILDATPKLETLTLGETAIGDATITRIGRLRELRTLVLSATRASRERLVELGGLAKLERLYLDETRADDAVLAALAPARGLRVLHLEQTDVSEASLPVLRGFARLEELTVGDTRMRGGITDLAAWPRLRTLSLLGLELGDAEVARLAAARSLARLDLSSTEVRDPGPLVALPKLVELGLTQTRLSPAGKAAVARLRARGVIVVR